MIEEVPSTIDRRRAARARLLAAGKLDGFSMKSEGCSTAPVDALGPVHRFASWLESHSNIAPTASGNGAIGQASAYRFVDDSKWGQVLWSGRKSSCDADISLLSDAAKIMNTHASGSSGGRERQMQASRTIRRAAEIEMLVEERNEDARRDVRGSVWNDPNFEPPSGFNGKCSTVASPTSRGRCSPC